MSADGVGLRAVDHALYLASATLFARKNPVNITLEFTVVNGEVTVFQERFLLWQRFDAERKLWVDIADVTYDTGPPSTTYEAGAPRIVSVTFRSFPGTGKTIVAGDERCLDRGPAEEPPGQRSACPSSARSVGRIATPQPGHASGRRRRERRDARPVEAGLSVR